MNISAPFIRRPVATSLLSMGLFLLGALAFPFLPLATLPEVEYPTITVFANLPGASPETRATAVAIPLERMFGRIASITQMTSPQSARQGAQKNITSTATPSKAEVAAAMKQANDA
jgi:multidrug efflux pump